MQSTIRFLKTNRYRKPIGSLDSLMGYGVHDALVSRGIAEWADGPTVSAAVISQPVVTTESPKRRSRRIETDEEAQ